MNSSQWLFKRQYRIDVELTVRQKVERRKDFDSIPVMCRSLDFDRILQGTGITVDTASILVVRYNRKNGVPCIFDADASGEGKYTLPHRFETEHSPYALPSPSHRKGTLVWLARNSSEKQYYSIYFGQPGDRIPEAPTCGGLVGDGDILASKRGRMSVMGRGRPAMYGSRLFGRKGLVVGSSYETGIYFFEETSSSGDRNFINRGRLKDAGGSIITGIPFLLRSEESGCLDLVVGRDNGTVYLHKNTGTDKEPVFSLPQPLMEESGNPIDLKNYLKGRSKVIRMADGTVNKRYPKRPIIQMHGGYLHIYTIPKFVRWSAPDRWDLLLGAAGFLIYFEAAGNGRFKKGVFLKDEKGREIECGYFPEIVSWNGNGPQDIIVGDSFGRLSYLKNAGRKDGLPVFINKGVVVEDREMMEIFPHVAKDGNAPVLFCGAVNGEVKEYRKISDAGGKPVFDKGTYLEMDNAWISRMMPLTSYVDLNGDGKMELLSGDERGHIYCYGNVGTNRNPVFSSGRKLRDESGEIKIKGGPDPTWAEDGYSKPVAADISGDGKKDILAGSGLGRIHFFRNAGIGADGYPFFKKGEVLKDTAGNEIFCHHMSALDVADWDGDGIPDIIVGGQKDVHALKDDDPDPGSQVRWYRGTRKKGSSGVMFCPYVPLEAEGDREFSYRPIPPIVYKWMGKKSLLIGNFIFRKKGRKNDSLEFAGFLPPRLVMAKENVINAYQTFSEFGKNDPWLVQGSCVGAVFAYRVSFMVNRGYLKAAFGFNELHSSGGLRIPLNKKIYEKPFAIKPRQIEVTKKHYIYPDGNKNTYAYTDFTDGRGMTPEDDKRVEIRVSYNKHEFILEGTFNEPLMERLIAEITHDNGPIQMDDFLSLTIDTEKDKNSYYCWFINSTGNRKEFNVERKTEEPHGPWRAGGRQKINVRTEVSGKSWSFQIRIPFSKLKAYPSRGDSWLVELKRYRNLYSNEIKAREQRLSDVYHWSGRDNGRVKLTFR